MNKELVIVLDFGGQYNQLVARRVRECNVYCEIYSYKTDLAKIKEMNPKGIILTGGPNSCYEDGAPSFDLNDSDYLEIMKESCRNLDYTAGIAAEKARNEQIKLLELAVPCISFNDLVELAKVITSECGSSWLPMEWKMAVGEVVLNRVASPEFPNTVYEVIHAHGQYANANTDYFDNLMPFEDCVEAAARLLSGERVMNEPSVVFQSNSKQGGGVCHALYDSYFGYTYLCYSSRPELYGG